MSTSNNAVRIIIIITLGLLSVIESTKATSADQDQLENLYNVFMFCTFPYSSNAYFEVFPKNGE